MEIHQEEDAVRSRSEYIQIMKGKRSKRPRQAFNVTSSSSSMLEEIGGGGGASDNSGTLDRATSPTNSGEVTDNTTEEADMANCLILLAQGRNRRLTEPVVQGLQASNFVYQCKTCDRCFPSFQALGGHRASHKKPKFSGAGEEKKHLPLLMAEVEDRLGHDCTALSLQITPNRVILPCATNQINKSRVHECSICGAEFSSGQALGGHMRRHRSVSTAATTSSSDDQCREVKKTRTAFALDLNLPAPEDDHHFESKFGFTSKEQVIVFSASPLIDCHY